MAHTLILPHTSLLIILNKISMCLLDCIILSARLGLNSSAPGQLGYLLHVGLSRLYTIQGSTKIVIEIEVEVVVLPTRGKLKKNLREARLTPCKK